MTTYVLVHGGGHGGWCYQKVKRILEAAGHEVFAPSLTGLAEQSHLLSPSIDLDLHIHDVVQVLHYWDLHDVVLVGHSYGGMVITGVAAGAADRIGKLVYLDAANPRTASRSSMSQVRSSKRPDRWARLSTASSSCCCRHRRRACSTA